jgi:hypothetical protein
VPETRVHFMVAADPQGVTAALAPLAGWTLGHFGVSWLDAVSFRHVMIGCWVISACPDWMSGEFGVAWFPHSRRRYDPCKRRSSLSSTVWGKGDGGCDTHLQGVLHARAHTRVRIRTCMHSVAFARTLPCTHAATRAISPAFSRVSCGRESTLSYSHVHARSHIVL